MDLAPPPMLSQQKNQQLIGNYIVKGNIAQQKKSNIFLVEKNGKQYALKMFHDTKQNKRIQNELNSLKQIDNENVVKMIDDFVHQQHQCIVMEYCEGGNLMQKLKKQPNKVFQEKEALNIFRCLLTGLTAIHQKGLIHRNLKLDNILIKDDKYKIGGFGISRELDEDSITISFVGTQQYLCPEIAMVVPYNYKVDIWSLGINLFAMLFYCYPFGTHNSQYKQGVAINTLCDPIFDINKALKIQNKKMGENAQKISDGVIDLFQKIFVVNQNNRINCQQLWQHPSVSLDIKIDPALYKYDLTESTEMNENMNVLVSKMTKCQTISKKTSEIQEEEQRMLESQKIDQNTQCMMLASKQLALSGTIQTQSAYQFQKNVLIYNFQIARYNVLIDQYFTLKDNMKFTLSISFVNVLCFRYFILKTALFYIKWLDIILEQNINQFKLQDFDQFILTQEYAKFKNIVSKDKQKYLEQFQTAYEDLYEYTQIGEIDEKQIQKAIQPEININEKSLYADIPDSIKIPFRAIMMSIFGEMYFLAQNYNNGKQKLAIQINDMFEKKRFSQNEGKIRLNFCLRLLVCCSINRVFEFNQYKIKTKMENYDFTEFLEWLHEVRNTEEEIDHIFKKYYPNFNYKNKQSFKMFNFQ